MKSLSSLKYVAGIGGLGLLVLTFQNCSGAGGFETIDAASEISLLSQAKVFGENSGTIPLIGEDSGSGDVIPVTEGTVSVGGTSGGLGGNNGGSHNTNGNGLVPIAGLTPTVDGSGESAISLSYVCSDRFSGARGNLFSASTLRVVLFKDSSSKACVYDDTTLRDKMRKNKALALSAISAGVKANCSGLADGQYYLGLGDPNKAATTTTMFGSTMNFSTGYKVISDLNFTTLSKSSILNVQTVKVASGNVSRTMKTASVAKIFYDLNRQTHLDPSTKCDSSHSPLLIQFNADASIGVEPLLLTPQASGIDFDIMGQNSEPVAHTPMRISWHRTTKYLFIVLPNANNQVNGVDEMFGDNTLGPDGLFANDGFAALAKYDGMSADGKTRIAPADGYITEADPIYSKLRLWRDSNFDGVAQAKDLLTLKEMGIVSIDLNYDPSYREIDKYGNEARYKSAVKTRDGRLHLLFDLWFKTEN